MVQRNEIPLERELAEELFAFWERIFGSEDPDIAMSVFVGNESEHNQLISYLERDGDVLMGTCGTTIARTIPQVAGFGEVATEPKYRGRGIATRLCGQAVEDFRKEGGEAIFLGTGNGDAARIYHRLGWRRMAGTNVWANITSGDSPEEYLVDYFRESSPVRMVSGDSSLRVPMIPLLLTPHDWQVLDGNLPTPMISTRYDTQNSCMGLCRKYYDLVKRDDAEWFAAKTSDNRLVGVSTARVGDSNICHVDGFTHNRHQDSWTTLIEASIEWGRSQNASGFATKLSVEDEDKQAMFESLGFRKAEMDGQYAFGGREVATLMMRLD